MVCRARKVVQMAQSTKVWIILIYTNKIRVKFGGVYTVRETFILEWAVKAQRGSRVTLCSFLPQP